jgi:hypothetical protein
MGFNCFNCNHIEPHGKGGYCLMCSVDNPKELCNQFHHNGNWYAAKRWKQYNLKHS